MIMIRLVILSSAFVAAVLAAAPRDSLPLDAPEWPQNFRLHIDGAAHVRLTDRVAIQLGADGSHDVAVEHPAEGMPVLRVWSGGKLVRGPEEVSMSTWTVGMDFPDANLDFGADFTAMATFESAGDGTLFLMCAPTGNWSAGAKALFICGGRLVYDIGFHGAMSGGTSIHDGKSHTVVLDVRAGAARLWLDGGLLVEKANFAMPDPEAHVFKVGRAAPDFGGDFKNGQINAKSRAF
jgi:hypothetical protein